MPLTPEQLKAYLANPSIAMQELAAKMRGAKADVETDKQDFADRQAETTFKLAGRQATPEQLQAEKENVLKNMEYAHSFAQSMGSINDRAAKIAQKLANNPEAAQAFSKLHNTAQKGSLPSATDAAVYAKLTGKTVPVVTPEKADAATAIVENKMLKKILPIRQGSGI